jgi:hypothetical protein
VRETVTDESVPEPRPKTATAVGSVVALGVALAVGFLPALFTRVSKSDDEGALLVTIRQFLSHGSLYDHTHGAYGPFYYSFYGSIFRLTGQSPTPFTGRLIVLVLTVLSSAFFAASAWRATKSVAFTLVGQLVTFSVLIRVAGNEPTHPGSLIALLLSILLYALVGYALEERTSFLVIAGISIGALVTTKINVGLLAVAAVTLAFVVGNRAFPKRWRTVVAAGGVLLPFVLVSQRLYETEMAEFALLVSLGLLLTYAPMHVDVVSLPRRALLVTGVSAALAAIAAALWPLANGTSPTKLVFGVLLQPLGQADNLTAPPFIRFEWLAVVIPVCGAYVALSHVRDRQSKPLGSAWLPNAALGVAALWVLGLGLGLFSGQFVPFVQWLPGIALLPALVWVSEVPPKLRLVLRFLVPVAILQILHAYPVAGSQSAWAVVAMTVPCIVALAIAAERLPLWQLAGRGARALAVVVLGTIVFVGAGASPVKAWHTYETSTALGLRGARWIRVNSALAVDLNQLTTVVRRDCDTFYSAPGFDSLYIYTGLPTPTGLLANWPGVLSDKEQRELVGDLTRARLSGKRVCIVRNLRRQKDWLESRYGKGPLGRGLASYQRRVARVGNYSISLYNQP